MHYIYDGTFEGLLTAVFYAFKNKQYDCEIIAENDLPNVSMFGSLKIITEQDKADRVIEGCRKKVSYGLVHDIYYIYLSEIPQSGTLIKDYISDGLRYGKYVYQYLHLPSVNSVTKLKKKVVAEIHRLKGLIRFSKYQSIYCADITPDFNVLPIIYRHFEVRIPNSDWIIRDLKRNIAALHFNGKTIFAETENLIYPATDADETERAWRQFYKSIAIEERKNEKLRRNMMPVRYHKNMTEFREIL